MKEIEEESPPSKTEDGAPNFSFGLRPGHPSGIAQPAPTGLVRTALRVGAGYMLLLPVAAYVTWQGKLIEGKVVTPSFTFALTAELLLAIGCADAERLGMG